MVGNIFWNCASGRRQEAMHGPMDAQLLLPGESECRWNFLYSYWVRAVWCSGNASFSNLGQITDYMFWGL